MDETIHIGSLTASEAEPGIDRRVIQRAMRSGLWIWPSFTLLDVYMCFVAYPGAPFALFVIYRVVIELLFLAVYHASSRESVDVQRLYHLHSLSYGATALTIALMSIHLGGIRSPYMHGISIVALVAAALVPAPWQRALPTFLGIGLAFPLVIGVGALISPAARAAWINPDALTNFVAHYVFVLTSAALGVVLCNMVWRAQQQVRTLGSYQLERLLGRGGMGEVWSARHRLLARSSAIKLIRPEALGGDAKSRRVVLTRFEREARTTASLRSPHTIQLYDFGVADTGTFYYVMELLEGFDAEILVEQFGPMHPDRAVHVLRQVCESLGEAHAAGLVHRDVKPSNVFVCRYGRTADFVKVLDFGLVKPGGAEDVRLTAEHVVSGTPAFMAPEQVMGGGKPDARSDLYSVGCVAYWLLTARHVFDGENALRVMMEHVHGTPVPPSACARLPVTPKLDRVVMACLEKDPANRPQSADELASALDEASPKGSWTQADARRWWDRHQPTAG